MEGLVIVLSEEVGSFWGFPVFDFTPYNEIKNSENADISSKFLNFNDFLLFQGIGNLQVFGVFDFDLYVKIENSWNLQIFSGLLIVLLEENGNFRGFWVFDSGPCT